MVASRSLPTWSISTQARAKVNKALQVAVPQLDELLVLQPGDEGTTAYLAAQVEDVGVLLDSGMSLNEILRPRTEPAAVSTLRLFND